MDKETLAVATSLLDGLTAAEVQAMALDALRAWRGRYPDRDVFAMHGDLGLELVPILAMRKGTVADVHRVKECFYAAQHEPSMKPIVELVWRLVRAGFLVPLVGSHDPGREYPIRYRLTTSGATFLDTRVDHPYLPHFLERTRTRCPGLSEDTFVHLADARECLDHGLRRPAIVLLGLAYETAIEQAVLKLVASTMLIDVPRQPWQRIADVRAVLPKRFPPKTDREALHAAEAAWDFADTMRRRRNDGSHTRPTFPFDDTAEVEEFLISAGRHLPALWSVAT